MSGPVPFSFHCIICFEAFDHDDRPPVILPCGHTYVCAQCSKRLDKCMECRQSLYIKPDGAGGGSGSGGSGAVESSSSAGAADNEPMPSWYRPPPGRHHHRDPMMLQPQHYKKGPPAKKVEPIHLPMPKNIVMMSLMEAAEQKKKLAKIKKEEQKRRLRGHGRSGTGRGRRPKGVDNKSPSSPRHRQFGSSGHGPPVDTVSITAAGIESIEKTDESFRRDQELDDDDNNSRSSGQDAEEGSSISDFYESESDDDESSKAYESGDDDSAVRIGIKSMLNTCGTYVVKDESGLVVLSHHPSQVVTQVESPPRPDAVVVIPNDESFHLSRGQTVQVAYVDDEGVAVLARGHGYIVADEEQLVKVGAPRDKACQIEGMLHSIEMKKQWYSKRLAELPLLQKKYSTDLDIVVREGGNPPVIGPSLFEAERDTKEDGDGTNENKAPTRTFVGETATDEHKRETSPTVVIEKEGDNSHTSPLRQPYEMTPRTPVTKTSPGASSNINCSPFTIDNSEIGPFVLSSESESDLRPLHYQPALTPQPLQREDSNNLVSNFSLGCGFLAGNSYLEAAQEEESLVGLSFDSAIDTAQLDRSGHSSSLPNPRSPERAINRPPEYPRTPDRSFGGLGGAGTTSFDTVDSSSRVDFRSGYSGHRGLLGAKSHADRMKAEQNRREIRTMGEHRGIGSRLVRNRGSKMSDVR